MRVGGALGRLLPWPLLPAALVDEPPPEEPLPALPLPLPIGCLPCGASAVPRARHDALNPCAMDTPSNCMGVMELGEGESGAVAHLTLSGFLALLLLDHQRPHALRPIDGLLRGLLGLRLLFGASGTF
jgi:hypothetical protein